MLALSFFLIALLYATVGFGGGSSYLALLSVSGIPFDIIPKLGLICNLLVVSGGCWHFWKQGHFKTKLIFPLVLSSVPFAFLGGLYPIAERNFLLLLAMTLLLVGLQIFFNTRYDNAETKTPGLFPSLLTGAVLGFLSGLVGIGGGIFLAPLMLNLKWAKPKEVAATASAFIWLNSVAGLSGQLLKTRQMEDLAFYWPLFIAVLIGGQLGSWIGSHHKISQTWIQKATAILILLVAGRLIIKLV